MEFHSNFKTPPTRSTLAKTIKPEIIPAYTATDIPIKLAKPITTGYMLLESIASVPRLYDEFTDCSWNY